MPTSNYGEVGNIFVVSYLAADGWALGHPLSKSSHLSPPKNTSQKNSTSHKSLTFNGLSYITFVTEGDDTTTTPLTLQKQKRIQ